MIFPTETFKGGNWWLMVAGEEHRSNLSPRLAIFLVNIDGGFY